jgi:hypothetical protein
MESRPKIGFKTLLLVVFSVSLASGQKISKSFQNVKSIKIKTVSGDCIIQKGSSTEVKVIVTHTYAENVLEPEIEQRGSRLYLAEKFSSRSWGSSHRGNSQWRVTVPDDILIDFSTASGDFEAADLKTEIGASTASGNITLKKVSGDVRASTASGEIEWTNVSGYSKASTASGSIRADGVKGEFSMSTASGTIRAKDLSGEMKLSTASGNVDASEVTITASSSFSAASGDVEIALAKTPEHDLKVTSASGDAVLDFSGNEIKGFIEMAARADRGRIRAPFKFDKEETVWRHDQEYMLKTVQKGSGGPMIEVRTASGTAEIKQ